MYNFVILSIAMNRACELGEANLSSVQNFVILSVAKNLNSVLPPSLRGDTRGEFCTTLAVTRHSPVETGYILSHSPVILSAAMNRACELGEANLNFVQSSVILSVAKNLNSVLPPSLRGDTRGEFCTTLAVTRHSPVETGYILSYSSDTRQQTKYIIRQPQKRRIK